MLGVASRCRCPTTSFPRRRESSFLSTGAGLAAKLDSRLRGNDGGMAGGDHLGSGDELYHTCWHAGSARRRGRGVDRSRHPLRGYGLCAEILRQFAHAMGRDPVTDSIDGMIAELAWERATSGIKGAEDARAAFKPRFAQAVASGAPLEGSRGRVRRPVGGARVGVAVVRGMVPDLQRLGHFSAGMAGGLAACRRNRQLYARRPSPNTAGPPSRR